MILTVCIIFPLLLNGIYGHPQDELEEVVAQLVALHGGPPVITYDDQDSSWKYDDEWVVRVSGGVRDAIWVANNTNSEYVGQLKGFPDLFLLRGTFLSNSARRRKREAIEFTQQLNTVEKVLWAEHQKIRQRTKRGLIPEPPANVLLNDPFWPQQWQMRNRANASSRWSHQIQEAWDLGFSGKGIVISVLDDGIDYKHEDLAANYEPSVSWDLNDGDDDPYPTLDDFNRHGTRCAGEIAMAANNSKCGVGVAFNAKVGAIRMLDGKITDRVEAEALNFAIDRVDIMSASWGPNDDGKTVEGPGTLAQMAILKGIRRGRQGKGTIYVWASGNGGGNSDDCNCDGYTDSIYTLAVSSADANGNYPWYGEQCVSTLTTTYSTGTNKNEMIVTTDPGNKCTTEHSGTSASAPIAVGIVALALEANSNLTWRDVQHLTVWTSQPEPLMNNGGWRINGAGLLVNSKFGFGLMNAFEIVKAAQNWTEVPQQRICTTRFPGFRKRMVSSRLSTAVEFETNACEGTRNEIKYVEHVQLIADIDATSRGHLAIWLESPQGTRSQLLSPRERDKSRAGFRHWPFMTVHHWGENPAGLWRLHVHDFNDRGAHSTPSGYINNITLVMYGTREQPAHYATGRTYEGIDLDAVGLSQNNTAELMETVSAVPFESLSVEQNNHLLQEDGEADRTLDRVVRNLRRLQDTNWWRTKNNGNLKSSASE